MRRVGGYFLHEAPLGGTQKAFKFCTDLLVPVAEGPSHHCPGAAFQASCGLTGLSPSAWVPKRLSSLRVRRPQGTLEQFEDVALHHLLHFSVSQGHCEVHWGVARVGLCGEVSTPGQ